jgi:hypothetical protein
MNDVTATVREGFAAGRLGNRQESNPYRSALALALRPPIGDGEYGTYARYAMNWDSGWIRGDAERAASGPLACEA